MNLKQCREMRGLSIRELSQKSGVSISTISHIETGKTKPYPTTVIKLAHALKVKIAKLLD